jgi:hypothetical protein
LTGAALAAIPAPNANDYLGGLTETGQDLQAEAAPRRRRQRRADDAAGYRHRRWARISAISR